MLIWVREILRPLVRWRTFAALVIVTVGCADTRTPTGIGSGNDDGVIVGQSKVIADQYIITFHEGGHVPPGLARKLVDENGGELRYEYGEALKGFAAKLPAQALAGLRNNPLIASIEPDMTISVTDVQSNPSSWGLDRIDQRALPVDKAYNYAFTGAGVTAYIIDSGIHFSHVDFEGRAIRGTDLIGDGQNGDDCRGHGTHVAGTVGGRTFGVAKKVTLVSVRVLNCNGSGTVSGAIAGIDWVMKNRKLPAVANISLGAAKNESLNNAVRNLIAAGVQIAVAAGNSNTDACTISPASTLEAVVVGAAGTEHINDRQTFSNWGSCVDVFAPGSLIISASHTDNTSSISRSGTSMASPHAAGAMALWLHENPALSPAQLHDMIIANATQNVVIDAKSENAHILHSLREGSAPPTSSTPPTASFTVNCSGLTCSMNASASSGGSHPIASYQWTYGDGGTGTGATTSRTYAASGSYTIVLTVTNSAGASATTSQTVSVSSTNQAPAADFSFSCELLACSFADQSTDSDGSVASWSWNFGDGTTSTSRHPSRTYAAAGTYTVRLTVTDDLGATSSTTRSVTVSADAPTAEFTFACDGTDCSFTDASVTGSAIRQWYWRFGDGTTSTVQNPTHHYGASGTYTVRLDVTDDKGATSSATRNVTVSTGGVTLAATPYKIKGQHVIDLSWSGATGSDVTIQRNGVTILTTPNDGAFTDVPGGKGHGNYRYRVCEASTGVCSEEILVQFR